MKPNAVVVEYVRGLSDEQLSELRMRFHQDLAGDKAMICELLSENKEVDKWLSKAASAQEFFDMLDQVGEIVIREYNRRESTTEKKKK